MPTIMNVNEAKTNFSGVLAEVERNMLTITITRYGRTIARVLPMPPRRLIARFMDKYGVAATPLTEEVVFRATELPQIHRDPADRFIMATALTENLPVVTTDHRFMQYGVSVLS